jgi:hypothetical protein
VRVAVYDPAAPAQGWQFVDGDGVGGLNRDATAHGRSVTMTVVDGTLYAAWREGSFSYNLYVAAYNGDDDSPAWSDAGGDLRYDSTEIPYDPDLSVFDGSLVAAWQEDTTIRAKIYDSTSGSWASFDGGAALNYSASSRAASPRLASLGDDLYLVWIEEDSAFRSQVRARVRDASGWRFIDGGDSAGLNYDALGEGVLDAASAFVLNGTLYSAFAEKDSGDVARLRVKAWNGDKDSPQWQFVDGGSSGGLNASSSYEAEHPVAIAHQGGIVVTWTQRVGDVLEFYDVRVIRGE